MIVVGDREVHAGLVQATDSDDSTQHLLASAELADRMARAHWQRMPVTW